MNILNCDICGTSFPDTEEKCPTCGYSRAFVEEMIDLPPARTHHERVRGGRYSKKNVLKRLKLLEKQEEADAAKSRDAEAAVDELVAKMESRAQQPQEEAEPAVQEPVENAPEKMEVHSGEDKIRFKEVNHDRDGDEQKQEDASRSARRRAARLNTALAAAILIFLGSVTYLAMHYGLIDAEALSAWIPAEITEFFATEPAEDVQSTDAPTEAATEASDEPSDETQSGTLSLNYEEMTFNSAEQAVQLYCEGYTAGEITWFSDNPSVATVNGSGQLVSVGPGTTYIWASVGGLSVKCVVYCKF